MHDINSSTLSFYMDPFQPAKQRWNQEYMYLQVCGPRVLRWPRLRQIWITWLAGTLTWFENPPFAKEMQYIGLIYYLYHLSYTWWDIRRVNWPSPRRLFLLAPRLPEVSGIVQRPTVISDEVGCVPTFPNAMEIEWVLKSGFVQHQCGGKSAPSLVTEVKRSHWPQLSPDCYGLRVRDEVSRQRYVQTR